jgi:hypothetical protein
MLICDGSIVSLLIHSCHSSRAYIIEKLREFAKGPLNAFDIFVTFLYLTVGSTGLAITIRVHELSAIVQEYILKQYDSRLTA